MPSVYCVFKHSRDTNLETVVGVLSGRYVHVDLVHLGSSYTSYMFETFSRNPVSYPDNAYTCLEVDVTEEESEAVLAYVEDLVERKVAYNYNDIVGVMLPFRGLVADSVEPVSRVYCSQAVLRCLRQSLVRNQVLVEALKGVNSRFISPNALFELLRAADVPCVPMDVLSAELEYSRSPRYSS